MEKLSKTSLNYYLAEYLEDLARAGVRDFRRVPNGSRPSSAERASSARPDVAGRSRPEEAVGDSPSASSEVAVDPSVQYVRDPKTLPRYIQEPTQLQPNSTSSANAEADDERARQLATIAAEVSRCSLCPQLVANRTQTVFGSGDPYAELCFIGEGPGAEEDLQGKPFVGRSGQLLTDMIEKGMGLQRSSVFICNIVRCRPPQNRNPERVEAQNCRKFLDATLAVVQPKYICCLGAIAATNLLGVDVAIGKLRGTVHDYQGAKVVCTYHPAYLLRNPSAKKQAWEDLKILMREMGLAIPGRR